MIKKYLFHRSADAADNAGGPAELTGVATPAQIAAWKEEYKGRIYALQVDDHIGYFRNPNRMHMNIAMSKASLESPLDMYDMLAKLTMIGGSEALLTDDDMFYGIVQQLKLKMDGKKAVLVNL